MKEKKKSIWGNSIFLTIAAMILGAVLGLVFGESMSEFKFIGDIWLNCLKMILVPMVFCTMTLAVGTQTDMRTLGRVALRIFLYYSITTALAVAMGLSVGLILKPGSGMTLEGFASTEVNGTTTFSVAVFFSGLFSSSMFKSFSEANMMQVIVISVMMGAALLGMKQEDQKRWILNALESVNNWIAVYLKAVIKMAPVGVLFLMADSFGKYGMVLLSSMFSLIGTYWLAILAQVVFVYCIILWFTAGVSPVKFVKDSMQVWSFTIATCSSVANIPNSIECAEKKFGVPPYIANFCVPLGAQINFDGSAILYGCVMIFLGNMYGLTFTPMELLQIVVVGTLVSSCGGGIPGSNLVKLMVVINTFALPSEIVGIIAGFYRLFDMGSTTGNCLGDLAGTIAVSNGEKKRAKKLGIELEAEELHM